jgi:hypothetical protein
LGSEEKSKYHKNSSYYAFVSFQMIQTRFKQTDVLLQKYRRLAIALQRAPSKHYQGEIFEFPRYPKSHDKKSMIFKLGKSINSFKFLDDNLFTVTSGIVSNKNCIFYKLMRDNVQKLFEAGITQKLKGTKYTNLQFYKDLIKVHDTTKNWIPLDLTMLEAGFIIWLIAVAISILVLLIEVLFYYLSILIERYQSRHRLFIIKKIAVSSVPKKINLKKLKKNKKIGKVSKIIKKFKKIKSQKPKSNIRKP